MKTNRWIDLSQRFYLQLLRLYPQAYREQYELEMFCVFTDQCREAYQDQGKRGILALWPRMLVDTGINVVSEHLTDPQASLGLLQANPNAPLPWKGVLLVLIPGLIFFVSQVEQVTSTNDWFFIAFYRAGYYLIVPVLLVWLLTRRFPVWGLIPLGLLYKLLGSYYPHDIFSNIPYVRNIKALRVDPFTSSYPVIDLNYFIPLSACVVVLCALVWYFIRQKQIPQTVWRWMIFFGLLVVFQIGVQLYVVITSQGVEWSTALRDPYAQYYITQMPLWYLYQSLPFLLLVFLGALFARSYGGLSFLLILGYLLPTIVFGRYGEWNEALPFYLVSMALLVYRFVVALVAPVWLVRAASVAKRQRAAAIPVAIAILTHISLNLIAYVAMANLTGYQPNALNFAMSIWDQLILAAGLGLAVALYLPREQESMSPAQLVPTTK